MGLVQVGEGRAHPGAPCQPWSQQIGIIEVWLVRQALDGPDGAHPWNVPVFIDTGLGCQVGQRSGLRLDRWAAAEQKDDGRRAHPQRPRTPPRRLPGRRETEADSVAYVVLAALGLDISSSTVEYVADWSRGEALRVPSSHGPSGEGS